jgi:hypothetical protein
VGLDTSYHGGAVLGDSDCQPEYISAFKKRREDKKRRHSGTSFKAPSPFEYPTDDTVPSEREAGDDR